MCVLLLANKYPQLPPNWRANTWVQRQWEGCFIFIHSFIETLPVVLISAVITTMARVLDIISLAFLISHIPITIFVDSQAGGPAADRSPAPLLACPNTSLLALAAQCSAAQELVPHLGQGDGPVVPGHLQGPTGARGSSFCCA